MSRVMLIAADKPLLLCDKQEQRTTVVQLPVLDKLKEMSGKAITVTALQGFRVTEHAYYRAAADALGHTMKPFQYELELDCCETDLNHLRNYLRANFTPGEEAELWNLWVGVDDLGAPLRYHGRLDAFDLESLSQFLKPPHADGGIGQCRMTVIV